MPVVDLEYQRLQKILQNKIPLKKIKDNIPFLGLDIESETKDTVRIEYSPNRPDFSTDFGIALGLQGLLGIKKGIIKLGIRNSNSYKIRADYSVSKIRPFVTGIVAKNGKIDHKVIKQLMVMQEDLHYGIGRRRKKSSIGIHDLDSISFPLKYTVTKKDHTFIPLSYESEKNITQILEETEVGREYGDILSNSELVPIILDSRGNTISFPPIINSASTAVTTQTKNLFVEVTGISKIDVEDMLSVVATILQSAGFKLYSTKISGGRNSTPLFKTRTMSIDAELVNKSLGLKLSPSSIVNSLRKCRLDASYQGGKIKCYIPRYRFDIFGPMDLVEEVALGFGINNIDPTLSPSQTIGQLNHQSESIKSLSIILIGLGYIEALNSSLTSKKILYELSNRDSSEMISVSDSKSQEYTILRDSILPCLLENLSKNIHETYPQKLFETGTVFSLGNPIKEDVNLSVVLAHQEANFSEIKSILQSMLKTGFNIFPETKTTENPLFRRGRTGQISINNKPFGVIGEINKDILENFKIRVPVVGFEIKLSGLIFD